EGREGVEVPALVEIRAELQVDAFAWPHCALRIRDSRRPANRIAGVGGRLWRRGLRLRNRRRDKHERRYPPGRPEHARIVALTAGSCSKSVDGHPPVRG